MKDTIIKRHVTLLEVMIAMALTALILMTLMFFYQQVVVIGSDIDRIKAEQFHIRFAENRLAYILPRIISKSDKLKDFAFFSVGDEGIAKPNSQGLIFTFDNGISLDKPFSNHVVGRLLLDPNGKLLLLYWPIPKTWDKAAGPLPVKKEILLENVESVSFEFFVAPAPPSTPEPEKPPTSDEKPPEDKKPGKKPEKKPEETSEQSPEPQGEWRRQPWLKEFKQLPVMVKVILTLSGKTESDEEKLIFVFPLVNNETHIIYGEDH